MGTVHGLDVGLPPHFHEEDQITFVFSGRRRFVVGNAPMEIGPGEVMRIPSWTPHRSLADVHELSCFNVYLNPGVYDVDGVLSALRSLCRRKAQAVCWPDIEAAIARYCSNALRPPLQRRPPDLDETVARLAQLSGMSREGFSRHFKRAHGLCPQAFQIMARLNSARELLRKENPQPSPRRGGFADQAIWAVISAVFLSHPRPVPARESTSVLEILPIKVSSETTIPY